jgi:hypothetical protein
MGRSKQPKEHPWPQILFLNHSLTTWNFYFQNYFITTLAWAN